jgi:hypothetical protein
MTSATAPGVVSGAPALRPRTVAELIDASVHLLRRHYLQLLSISAVFLIPATLVGVVFRPSVPQVPVVPGAPLRALASMGPLFLLMVPFMLLSVLGSAAVLVGISDSYVRDRVDVGQAIGRVLSRTFQIIGGFILQLLTAFAGSFLVGFVVFVLAGILVAIIPVPIVRFLLIAAAVLVWIVGALAVTARVFAVQMIIVLERSSVMDAFRRSIELTKNQVGRVIGVFSITGVVLVAIYALTMFIMIGLSGNFTRTGQASPVAQVLGSVLNLLTYPVYTIFLTLLYYDLRIRKEGFDLEIMAKELGADAPAPVAA